ncbi:MAG: hypothetical protein AABX91_01615 [Nanoarchaeota archaeon]|mgnify:CR=1 FL=1
MTSQSNFKDYSLRMVDSLYAHMMASEAIDSFREADEIEADGIKDGEPYLVQKAEERRYVALELMACAFGPTFSPHNRRLHIH